MTAEFFVRKKFSTDVVIALIGNPNVGKSTLFNALTGMKQHTGNWPGKTVEIAQGRYEYKGRGYILVDLPGTYSLDSRSEEERVAVEFITSSQADCVLMVGDATCLERNLNMLLQIMAQTDRLIFCLNLLDEAKRKDIMIDTMLLEKKLGVPVVGTAAVSGQGLNCLQEAIRSMADGFMPCNPILVERSRISTVAAEIASAVASVGKLDPNPTDRIVLGKWTGYSIILLLMLIVFFLTISGANYLSSGLEYLFDLIGTQLSRILDGIPEWCSSLIREGVYDTVTCVISVMLPPMLIFYPLFSFLEDLGYLPRAAFLMDHRFSKCGSCGKQALTTAMGFGCNTVGVMGCRIISSPKERLIGILTNSLVPCNGRFPTIILLITSYLAHYSIVAAFLLLGFILLSIGMTFLLSGILSAVIKKEESYFVLELPPYRLPCIKHIVIKALRDRTAYILGRAVLVSAPTGVLIWCFTHIELSGIPLLSVFASGLDPIGFLMGMNGAILLAFILSFPANELFLPLSVTIMQSMSDTSMGSEMMAVFSAHGVTWKTALCMIVFTLFHWPCGTTCLTIRKETGSWKWMILAIIVPTLLGCLSCIVINLILNISFIF